MNLLHLEYFRELANCEHLLNTSQKLHVSAPAISASLRSLEEELGVNLFDRVGRNLVLNDKGRAFLPYVEKIFQDLHDGQEAVQRASGRSSETVSFSIKDSILFAGVIRAFFRQHPTCILRQVDEDPNEDGKLIQQKKLDLMITAMDLTDNPKLDSLVINNDYYVLIVSKSHPLAGRGSCCLAELRNEVFLSRPPDNVFEMCVSSIFKKNDFKPQTKMEFSYALRTRMVKAGIGVGISTELSLPSPLYRDICALKVDEFRDERYCVRAYWRNDRPLSPIAASLRDFLFVSLEGQRDDLVEKLRARGIYPPA